MHRRVLASVQSRKETAAVACHLIKPSQIHLTAALKTFQTEIQPLSFGFIRSVLRLIAKPLTSLRTMKSIVLNSTLAVIGCIALSIAAAVLAASPDLQDEARGVSPPAAASAQTPG